MCYLCVCVCVCVCVSLRVCGWTWAHKLPCNPLDKLVFKCYNGGVERYLQITTGVHVDTYMYMHALKISYCQM